MLELLGTPIDVIVDDYALTGLFPPNRVAAYAPLFEAAGVSTEQVRALFETPRTAMELALAYLSDRYGSTRRYLITAGGLPPDVIGRLERALVG